MAGTLSEFEHSAGPLLGDAMALTFSSVLKLFWLTTMFDTICQARSMLYNAFPYDVQGSTYFEKATLPEGALTDIPVSSAVRSSDFLTVRA